MVSEQLAAPAAGGRLGKANRVPADSGALAARTPLENPRPLSSAFRHQPVGWNIAVPDANACRRIATLSPG